MVDGVHSRRGTATRWIRHGCGLKQSAAKNASASLVALGLLEKRRRSDAKKGNLSTQYEIRWAALRAYFVEKSGTKMSSLGRHTAKGSTEPLQTGPSEPPLAATWLSPWPRHGQEQYLDYYSAGKSRLAAMSAFDGVLLNESKNSKADYSFASAKITEGSESNFDTVSLSEANNRKADYSLASAKPADVRSCPQARKPTSKPADPDSEQVHEVSVENLSVESQEQPPASLPDPARLARAKLWTAYELQMVRDRGSVYMEGDTPPANFEWNCELAAVGHTAAEVIACLDSKFAKKRYRPGGRFGPSSWNWFYTVIRERFSATERGHLPE
jgi:hypothetical protein